MPKVEKGNPPKKIVRYGIIASNRGGHWLDHLRRP